MTYSTNKGIPTLSEVRKREREENEKKLNTEAKELLKKAISYYDQNYPNSNHKNIWNKTKTVLKIGELELKKEIEIFNEEELYAIYEILAYFHDERQMIKVEEHNLRAKIQKIVRKKIPGGIFIDNLYKLYETQRKINAEIKDLENRLTKERKDLIDQLERSDEVEKRESFTCKDCEKICRSAAGLKSHSRKHEV